MRQTVGLFGGAFKPFHAGHYAAINKIANETDKLVLFVSSGDRIKKGEFPLYWSNMKEIWSKYLTGILPKNTEAYLTPNPVRAMYDYLGKADENKDDHNTYYIYASEEDLQKRFNEEKLKKYFERLFSEEQIEAKETGTRDIVSGTDMRKFLMNKNLESFVAGLPGPIQRYGEEIFNILSKPI